MQQIAQQSSCLYSMLYIQVEKKQELVSLKVLKSSNLILKPRRFVQVLLARATCWEVQFYFCKILTTLCLYKNLYHHKIDSNWFSKFSCTLSSTNMPSRSRPLKGEKGAGPNPLSLFSENNGQIQIKQINSHRSILVSDRTGLLLLSTFGHHMTFLATSS